MDIDLHINISFLDEEVSTAWKVLRTEPIVLRLRFSLSQYLDGPGKGSGFWAGGFSESDLIQSPELHETEKN